MRLLLGSLLIVSLFAIGCSDSAGAGSPAMSSDGTNLEARYPTGVAVVYFYSTTCASCKAQNAQNPEIAAALDPLGVTFAKINPNGTTIRRYNLTRFPTIVVLHNGAIIKRWTGVVYKEDIMPVVRSALGR
ncbi:MAG: thioredoxin family protein [Planctomycetes bacterium]|nr:thioredoxin family protein [Planctomycetota bacterium]